MAGSATIYGYDTQYSVGSIVPSTVYGNSIYRMRSVYNSVGATWTTSVQITADLTQDFFSSILGNGITVLTATADSYITGGGHTAWTWNNTPMFTTTGDYIVTMFF